MRNIGEFFRKIQNRQAASFFLQKIVSEVLKDVANIEVSENNVVISRSEIILKGISQSAKSEIFIKKEKILKEINKRQDKVITSLKT